MVIEDCDYVLKTLILLRRGTKEEWEKQNPTLSEGEPGIELDTFRAKVGDGKTQWKDLPYLDNRPIPLEDKKENLNKVAEITNTDFAQTEEGVGPYTCTKEITHNMGKYPAITMIDESGDLVTGKITYTDGNSLTVILSLPDAPAEGTKISIYLV